MYEQIIAQEKEMMSFMIGLYCRKKHRQREICPACRELLDYAMLRVERCPKRKVKTFCSSCTTHCYQKEKREQVREVMRFAGPRLFFYRPKWAWKHLMDTIQKKKGAKNGESKQSDKP